MRLIRAGFTTVGSPVRIVGLMNLHWKGDPGEGSGDHLEKLLKIDMLLHEF